MIQQNANLENKPVVKAVGMISGGLDSTVAAKLVKNLGVDVHGVYFAMPWGCCDKAKAIEAANHIGIKFIVLQLDERYLEMVRSPKHGYGSQMNPCIDCRIHMFKRAAQYMRHISADFVFTGEVLGQRPMSQVRRSLKWIEDESGLTGRLLRPLSAQLMEPTIPETEGLIDRDKLLELNGRSRTAQIKLAKDYNITNYPSPAGGCLLTEEPFARRMKDTLEFGYRNFRETISLKWGRHFRISKDYKIILGRDKDENESLIRHAQPDDHILQLEDNLGPTGIVIGKEPNEDVLKLCAGLVQHFSRYRDDAPLHMKVWKASDKNSITMVLAMKVDEAKITQMTI